MASYASPPVVVLLLLLSVSVAAIIASAGKIGVDYGRIADNLPSPTEVVRLLKREGVTNVHIYDTDHTVLDAFKGSGISLIVCLPNEQISQAASDQSFTDNWVATNIVPYYPSTAITIITAGNEVTRDPNITPQLVPAMRNLHTSLQNHGLDGSIKISSPFPYEIVTTSYPPSQGVFDPNLVDSLIDPLLDFLDETSSPLMINVYPFFAYAAQPDKIPLDYALIEPTAQGVTDQNTGLHYPSLLEAQMDAVYFAISKRDPPNTNTNTNTNINRLQITSSDDTLNTLDAVNRGNGGRQRRGHPKVIWPETGWSHIPGEGSRRRLLDSTDFAATKANSEAYNRNLVKRVLTGGGTPSRPNEPLEVYIFSLFNENEKPGDKAEGNFGLFYPDGTKVYEISLTSGAQPPSPEVWCVAKGDAPAGTVQKGLDYACGPQGGVDCRDIQSGGSCFEPNTLLAHATWAFSRYYKAKSSVGGTCDFGGAATLTTQQPTMCQSHKMWCVAKGDAPADKLQKGLDYACGQVDCGPINPGGGCYEPNTLQAHATWAFDKYYQAKSGAGATCDFGGAATLSSQQPASCSATAPPKMWCVAKGGAPANKLQSALDYACGNGADCGPIQTGGSCYQPNTLEAHASWAINSYYQKKSSSGGTCDFGGIATLTSQQPRYGNCVFP